MPKKCCLTSDFAVINERAELCVVPFTSTVTRRQKIYEQYDLYERGLCEGYL